MSAYCIERGAECIDKLACTAHGCAYANAREHPAAAKQREQMHKTVARDAKLQREDITERRRKAEAADARRNQPVTRGELLDAIDQAIENAYARAGNDAVTALAILREAFA